MRPRQLVGSEHSTYFIGSNWSVHDQGKRHEAYEILAPVYEGFTEGFDTGDLKETNALPEALS